MDDPRRALWIGIAVGLLAGSAWGQPSPGIFLDSIDVDVVNVEVVVTDRRGDPVHGLTREDFAVREDGEPVELTNFYAVESGHRVAGSTRAEGAEADGALAPLPPDQRLNLVVLVDNLDISPASRNRIFNELEDRLATILRPGDRVMVAEANPEVRVVQAFTEDPTTVWDTFDRLRTTISRTGMHEMEARDIRRAIFESGTADAPLDRSSTGSPFDAPGREILDRIHAWSASRHALNRTLLATLDRFVEALAGLPGRRAVLFVSDGFAVRPAEPLMEEWFQAFATSNRALGVSSPQSEASRWDVTPELIDLARVATGNRVTFYTLESGSPFRSNLDPQVRHAGSPSGVADLVDRGSLAGLARRTGGFSLKTDNVDLLLDRIASDYQDYYSLGFAQRHPKDGAFRPIEVAVPGRRVRVRHNRGYRATTPEQETIEQTMSALVLDVGENPLGVRVEVGNRQRHKRKYILLPVLVRIPIAGLTLLPGESVHQGMVSIVVAVQDVQGGLAPPHREEVSVEIPAERLADATDLQIAKGINLAMRAGATILAVGVRDELSGTRSIVRLELPGDGE